MKIHQFKLYQEFNTPVEKLFDAFADHVSMGKIFGQKFTRVVDSKDPSDINGVGSVRKVHIPVFGFEETIRKSEKPNRLEYQISKGTPLHHHYGTMVFKSLPNGKSAVDYTVELGSKLPIVAPFLKTVLVLLMGSGLKRYAKKLEAKK